MHSDSKASDYTRAHVYRALNQRSFAGLGRLLQEFQEELVHIVLEALAVVIKADAQAAAVWEPHMTPAVLRLWAANVADPLISVDTAAVLQALAANPAALPSLQVRHSLPPCLF